MTGLLSAEQLAEYGNWCQPCGACDGGLPMLCSHPQGDPRTVIGHLLAHIHASQRGPLSGGADGLLSAGEVEAYRMALLDEAALSPEGVAELFGHIDALTAQHATDVADYEAQIRSLDNQLAAMMADRNRVARECADARDDAATARAEAEEATTARAEIARERDQYGYWLGELFRAILRADEPELDRDTYRKATKRAAAALAVADAHITRDNAYDATLDHPANLDLLGPLADAQRACRTTITAYRLATR